MAGLQSNKWPVNGKADPLFLKPENLLALVGEGPESGGRPDELPFVVAGLVAGARGAVGAHGLAAGPSVGGDADLEQRMLIDVIIIHAQLRKFTHHPLTAKRARTLLITPVVLLPSSRVIS